MVCFEVKKNRGFVLSYGNFLTCFQQEASIRATTEKQSVVSCTIMGQLIWSFDNCQSDLTLHKYLSTYLSLESNKALVS